eukprot:6191410-Pleurochrysis_carterae.AAC.1
MRMCAGARAHRLLPATSFHSFLAHTLAFPALNDQALASIRRPSGPCCVRASALPRYVRARVLLSAYSIDSVSECVTTRAPAHDFCHPYTPPARSRAGVSAPFGRWRARARRRAAHAAPRASVR